MTREEVQTYTMQITQANASQLLCIAYALWECYAEDAMREYEAAHSQQLMQTLKKLQRVNHQIVLMLNRENACARDVREIHLFLNRKLTSYLVTGKPDELMRMKQMVGRLHESFDKLSSTDTEPPIMQNAQQIYAGLTYGKGTLNESMDPLAQTGRGFFA